MAVFPPFSVLMSLYKNEKAAFFEACVQSVLRNTVLPAEITVVLDGPIAEDVRLVLDVFLREHPKLFKTIDLGTNRGLGEALRIGVLECSNALIARVDTDDICREDRFELQLEEFEKDPELDICGSHILEFEGDIRNIVAKRIVPLEHEEIKKYQKRRDGFNHMTVMYKKEAVLRAGNYQSCLLMEDSLLWANMFLSGAKSKNIDDFLVYARVGEEMFGRRGGFAYYKKYKKGRAEIYRTGFIGRWDYLMTVVVQFFVSILPNKLRSILFKRFLHRK